MCKNKFKKVMSLICATTCILSLSIPCMAADTTSPEDYYSYKYYGCCSTRGAK